MTLKTLALVILLVTPIIHAKLIVWSNEKVELLPFKMFTDDTLSNLQEALDNPKTIILRGQFDDANSDLVNTITSEHTSYVPIVNLNLAQYKVLPLSDWEDVKQSLQSRKERNYLVLVLEPDREKRSVDSTTTESAESTIETINDPNAPIVYKDVNGIALIYSSRLPVITINEKNDTLGRASSVTLDTRGNTTRVLVTIPYESDKMVLRFQYIWSLGYWSLTYVEVMNIDNKSYNLTATSPIYASRRFSYHCQGVTTFTSDDANVTLQLYNLQIQPNATKGRFGDANDCVPFMTGPIWSGLFVNFILMTVLMIGIGALFSIKTNDKYENSKSKQLIISVNE